MKPQAASAIVPGASHLRAMEIISSGVADPCFGPIAIGHVQLCPQHAGALDEELVDRLMELYPQTQFRLHASPRCRGFRDHHILDAINAFEAPEQLAQMAKLSKQMRAPAYSMHAGHKSFGTLDQAIENLARISDLFECPVAIEGLYPTPGRISRLLLSSWDDYAYLLNAGVPFAIDLSHLLIVAARERRREDMLVQELLSSPHCLEVHVSNNNTRADSHAPLDPNALPWWYPMLNAIHPNAIIFYEGVLRGPRQ